MEISIKPKMHFLTKRYLYFEYIVWYYLLDILDKIKLFNSLVIQILNHGSEVWEVSFRRWGRKFTFELV